jgi:DNA-binding CsgD family transcriptional regulator
MRRSTVRDVRAAVSDAARRARTGVELERDVARQVARAVPFDLWCGLTLDPATLLPTGGYHAEGLPAQHLPRLLEIEHGPVREAMMDLRVLAAAPVPAQTLSAATGGDPARSIRYRDVLQPSGVRHELRTITRGPGGAWGALILFRGDDVSDFTASETNLLCALGPTVAEGLRRAAVLDTTRPAPDNPDADGPGLLLIRVEDGIQIEHATTAARDRLTTIDDGTVQVLPAAIVTLVHSATLDPHHQHRARMRTRTGAWLTAHAERLGPTLVSVILEPTRSRELAELRADAYRLTPRERQVAALAVQGRTNTEIAETLFLSVFTVQDHLKQIYTKTGATGRTDLNTRLFAH